MNASLIKIPFVVITAMLIASCGEQDPKDRLEELKKQKSEIELEIDSLEKVVGGEKVTPNYVGVESLGKKDFQNYFDVQGTTEAAKDVLINSESAGLIRKIYVEEGQKVSKGQTLMILDAELISKNIQEVEKSLELAEFVFEKQKNLHDQNIGSELQFQQAKNNKERLEETLKTLKAQRGKSVVTAPFSGHIDEIFVSEGQMAMPQVPLIRMLDLTGVTVKADVMESYLKDILPSTKVDINITSLDTLLENVSLTRIGKFVNTTNRAFIIEAKLVNKNERILPNLIANIRVNHSVLKDVFVIPTEALQQSSSGQNFIYVMEETTDTKTKKKVKTARKIIVERVATNRETKESVIRDMEGRSELSAGMTLIVKGARGVKNGMAVEIKK
jgi:membrane fusion protein (multidrug efflux system)